MKIFSRAKVLLLPLVALLTANAAYAFQDCELTPEQRSVLHFSYSYGEPHDYGYTMAAIAMEESRLGKYNIGLDAHSFGPWHVTVDKALIEMEWEDTLFNRNRAAQLMLDDIYFSAKLALKEILWWHGVRNGQYLRVIESFNAGYGRNSEYVRRIAQNIKTIKECKWIGEE